MTANALARLDEFQVDPRAVLQAMGLDPRNPKDQAVIMICQAYNLDPVLRHVVLVDKNPYITRDGLLKVAHASGQFDGIGVVEEGENDDEWWAIVAVWRKDMSRPFTYRGRYPKTSPNKKFGPEMAVKCGEVMSLRRAFAVSMPTREERWDVDPDQVAEVTPEQVEREALSIRVGDLVKELMAIDRAALRGFTAAREVTNPKELAEWQQLASVDQLQTAIEDLEALLDANAADVEVVEEVAPSWVHDAAAEQQHPVIEHPDEPPQPDGIYAGSEPPEEPF